MEGVRVNNLVAIVRRQSFVTGLRYWTSMEHKFTTRYVCAVNALSRDSQRPAVVG